MRLTMLDHNVSTLFIHSMLVMESNLSDLIHFNAGHSTKLGCKETYKSLFHGCNNFILVFHMKELFNLPQAIDFKRSKSTNLSRKWLLTIILFKHNLLNIYLHHE